MREFTEEPVILANNKMAVAEGTITYEIINGLDKS